MQQTIDDLVLMEKEEAKIVEVHRQVTANGDFDWHLYLTELRPRIVSFTQDYPLHSSEYEHLLSLYDPLAWKVEEPQQDNTSLYLGD